MVPIVLVQMFLWNTWGETRHPIRLSFPQGPSRPVFVFIFDEWSFVRTAAPDGQFPKNLPHLRELAEHSVFFRHALSPGPDTYRSLPLLIYGDAKLSKLSGGDAGRTWSFSDRPQWLRKLRRLLWRHVCHGGSPVLCL